MRAAAMFVFLVAFAGLPLSAIAHGDAAVWRAVVDSVGREDILVQIHSSPLGSQLLMENRTGKMLEVDGPSGRAFLRLGPDGVHADIAAADWHHSQNPGRRPLPEQARDPDATPQWHKINDAPHWGWFDPRVQPPGAGDHPQRWRIPLRLNGEAAAITGYFQSLAAPASLAQPRLSPDLNLPRKLKLRLILDPNPAIMLTYRGESPVTVFDNSGQPLLRFDQEGVHANLTSPGWQALGRAPQVAGDKTWIQVSNTPRYSWPDPRLQAANVSSDSDSDSGQWSIPILIGEEMSVISGDWLLIKPAHQGVQSRLGPGY